MGTTLDRTQTDETLQDLERFLEVREGEPYMPPAPNNEHFRVSIRIASAFSSAIDWDAGDFTATGGNVTDRDGDWRFNYRIPDVLVALHGGRAVDRGSHWFGGPDVLVEVLSEGEDLTDKIAFYGSVGVRECVVIERHPWTVDLLHLQSGTLASVGRSDEVNGVVLTSAVLPISYRVVPGTAPVRVEVTNLRVNQVWNVAG